MTTIISDSQFDEIFKEKDLIVLDFFCTMVWSM